MAGAAQRGNGARLEEVGQTVKALGVKESDQAGEEADEGEPHQLDGVGEVVALHVAEER